MEKAYDLTWRNDILMDIQESGKERRIFNFIQEFLILRSFEVKVNKILSGTKVQIDGKPQ